MINCMESGAFAAVEPKHVNNFIDYEDNSLIPEWSKDAVSLLKIIRILPAGERKLEPDRQVGQPRGSRIYTVQTSKGILLSGIKD